MEQIVDAPVPQAVEELAEVSRVFSQDRIQQRAVEQTIENPATSLAEMIVEVPVIQTPERTQQVVNTSVHHVVNTVEVDKPKLVKETVQEKINQVTKHIKIPQVQFLNKVDDMLVDVQRQIPVAQTMQKTMEVPPSHVTDKVSVIPVVVPKQILPMAQTVQKTTEIPQLQFPDQAVDVPVVMQRQIPSIETVPKTVEVPQTQHIDKVADVPVARPRQTLSVQRVQKTVEVPQIQFIDKLIDSHVNMRSVPEVEHVVPTPVTEHMASAPAQSHADVSAGVKSDITWTKELAEIRQMVEFLVRRERKLDAKTDVAVRRLERLEREQDEQDDHDREASMTEALADKTKVVKLVVDKWFVDRGFGFGKVPTGEIVFIHASAVVGAEVLTIGTDAWVQVVNDDARARGGYRARRAWGQDVWQAEKDKEKANKVAQQVRRAGALTAELAAQSEKKTAAVCDQPPGLDELAGHIEAPNMGAGGSHPQATMMPDPWATFKCPSANQAMVTSPLPASQSFSNFSGMSRKGRPRSSTRAQDNTAVLEETLRLFVEATDKDEASMRQQL